jgi:cytochrome c
MPASQASNGSSPGRRSSAGTADKYSASNVLYNQNCQRCHDKDGSGAKSKDSLRGIPDFRRVSWHEKRSDSELVISILDGKGKNMPSFGDRLSKSQARELVAFLRAFNATEQQEKLSPIMPTKNSPTEFDVRFRELQEQMKELQRQFNELSSSPKKPQNR